MSRCCWRLLVAACLVSGCSQNFGLPKFPKTYPVRGKVLFDGKPLRAGAVVLNPTSEKHGLRAEGSLNKDGSFEIETFAKNDGAVPGSYVITIRPASDTKDPKAKDAKAKEAELKKGPPAHVPAKYLMPDSSGIDVRVEEKDNDLGTIKLESEKPAGKKK